VQKQTSRALLWTIAGMVLGVSVVLGGLAGFMVGTRGKVMTAVPSATRAPAAAVPQEQPDDDPTAKVEPVPKAKNALPSKPTALGKTPEATKGKEAAPAATTPPAAVAKAAMKDVPDKTLPAGKAPSTLPAAALGKGAGDAPGSGELVNVSITSQPEGAMVWINGKEQGRTPLQARVPSGSARVVLILAGHGLAASDITASEGAKVSKQLTAIDPPLEGEARFRAECTTQGKLPIVIDGKETGMLCPFSKLRVEPGVHKIGLFVPTLGAVHEKEVTLRPGVRSIVFAD
jgi:hypothetical protein